MTWFVREVRLIPVVLFATISLFALKVSGLVFDGGYTLAERLQARYADRAGASSGAGGQVNPTVQRTAGERDRSPEQGQFSFKWPEGDVTGSVGAEDKQSTPGLKVSDKPPDPTKLEVAGATVPLEPGRIASPGERAVLERLQSRRQELHHGALCGRRGLGS